MHREEENASELDTLDKAILNRIQSDFPITSAPFKTLAEELDISETELMDRLSALKKNGIIRRIGGNFVPEKLGFVSTLCAARVPEDKIEDFTRIVNRYPGVTHNYERDNDINIWFTFIAPSMSDIEHNLEEIARETGVKEILNLPATDVYKIRAQFDL